MASIVEKFRPVSMRSTGQRRGARQTTSPYHDTEYWVADFGDITLLLYRAPRQPSRWASCLGETLLPGRVDGLELPHATRLTMMVRLPIMMSFDDSIWLPRKMAIKPHIIRLHYLYFHWLAHENWLISGAPHMAWLRFHCHIFRRRKSRTHHERKVASASFHRHAIANSLATLQSAILHLPLFQKI